MTVCIVPILLTREVLVELDPALSDDAAGQLFYLLENIASLHGGTDMAWLAGRFEFLGEKAIGASMTALILPDEVGVYRATASASPRPTRARDLWESLGLDDLSANDTAAAIFGEAQSHARAISYAPDELFPGCHYAGADDAIVAPISFNSELIGVGLLIVKKSEMTAALAGVLTNHTAVAIHQLRLRDDARRLHSMDPKLWVPDEDFLIMQLRREVARARRYGRMSGVALLRLENEREVRAQFGDFYAGHMLRRVGSQLLASVRDSDVVGALDGGYAIIHTETSHDGTQLSAERLRDAVVKMIEQRFPEAPAPEMSVTAASFPEDGASVDDLLAALAATTASAADVITDIAA